MILPTTSIAHQLCLDHKADAIRDFSAFGTNNILLFSSVLSEWPGISSKPKAPLKGGMTCKSSLKEMKVFATK